MTETSFVGMYFHAGKPNANNYVLRGRIAESVAPGFFLVCLFAPLKENDSMVIVPVAEMLDWKFYYSLEMMTEGCNRAEWLETK